LERLCHLIALNTPEGKRDIVAEIGKKDRNATGTLLKENTLNTVYLHMLEARGYTSAETWSDYVI
jgi:hypothetical protein